MNDLEYSGYQDFQWAVQVNRISLEVIGLWPKPMQNYREKLTANLRTFVTFLLLLISIVPLVHSLIRIYSDIMLAVDNLLFTLPISTCIIRIIILWWKKDAVIHIVTMMVEDWLKPKNIQERNLMIKWARLARIIAICAYSVTGMAYFCITVLPRFNITPRYVTNITDPDRLLIIQAYYMYDITKRIYYEITFISQAVFLFFASVSYVGVDNLLGMLVFHICGQLDILQNRLSHLHEYSNSSDSLRTNIADHKRLLRTIVLLENSFNIILLVLFLYCAIFFAFCGFLIINLLEDRNNMSIARLLCLIIIAIVAIGHMFLYCAIGELLIIQCDNIYYAVCNQKWYSLHPKHAKNLILLLIRSNNPSYLTAGKVFHMTLYTFCSLLKTSTGYISVLHAAKR